MTIKKRLGLFHLSLIRSKLTINLFIPKQNTVRYNHYPLTAIVIIFTPLYAFETKVCPCCFTFCVDYTARNAIGVGGLDDGCRGDDGKKSGCRGDDVHGACPPVANKTTP